MIGRYIDVGILEHDGGGMAAEISADKYRNAGQICVASTRFIVHEQLNEPFVRSFRRGQGGDGRRRHDARLHHGTARDRAPLWLGC